MPTPRISSTCLMVTRALALACVTVLNAPRPHAKASPDLAHSGAAADIPAGSLAGGGPIHHDHGRCITPAMRARVAERIEQFENAHPWLAAGRSTRGFDPLKFGFFPQAGNLYRDLYPNNFVDLDNGPGLLDWNCSDHTYDGHLGHDTDLRSFAEQEIGVPVFAVLGGIVVDAQDGFFDMSTNFNNPQPANFVVLSHGSGDYTYYWHLKRNSVAVQIGEQVAAGTQLGLTASSGYSTGPHLHFEVFRNGVGTVEPSTGTCNPGESWWRDQTPIRHDLYIRDFGFVQGDLGAIHQGLPFAFPRSSHIHDTRVFPTYVEASYWIQGHSLPQGSTWRMRFRNPQGQIAFDSGTNAFGWATQDFRSWWAWWRYDIPDMRFNHGEWQLELSINNAVVVDTPINVFRDEQPNFNRAPAPVTVSLDPSSPVQNEPLFCRVATDLVDDDPDFDLVSYRYRWTVNGQTVRDVTTAAHSDAIAADQALGDSTITCTVTPTDGSLSAPPANASVFVQGFPCNIADLRTPFGTLDLGDISAFVSGFTGRLSYADLNDDGVYDLGDISLFVTNFSAGCP